MSDLLDAVKLALGAIPSGPTLGEFGIVREDCVVVHIDYFGSIDSAVSVLTNAVAAAEGIEPSEAHRRYCQPPKPCDCPSCIGKDAAAAARKRHEATLSP